MSEAVQQPMFPGQLQVAPGSSERTLAFDFGTHTGWAYVPVCAEGKLLSCESGCLNLVGGEARRLAQFEAALYELAVRFKPTRLAYEQVEFAQGAWRALYFSQRAVMLLASVDLGLPLVGVPVSAVKQMATGNSKADKADIMEAALGVLGRPVLNDHEADALFVGIAGGRDG